MKGIDLPINDALKRLGRTRFTGTVRVLPLPWMIVALAVFAGLRVLAVVHSPATFNDTGSYTTINFVGGAQRPWTVPLVWGVLGTPGLREAGQITFGVLAWSMLALSLRATISNRWARCLAVLGVVLLGLTPQIAGWDALLLSESLATSLFVLLVALLLRLRHSQSVRLLVACIAVLALWAFARQTNIMIFIGVAPFVLAFALLRLPRRRAGWVCAALILIAVWGGYDITRPIPQGAPWENNAVTIITDRVAGNPSELRFFQSRGMPDVSGVVAAHAALVQRRLAAYASDWAALEKDARFHRWRDDDFTATYFAYLKDHLFGTLTQPLLHSPPYLAGPFAYGSIGPDAPRAVLPQPIGRVLWSDSPDDRPLLIWLGIAVALGVAAAARRRRVSSLPVVGSLLLTSVVGSMLIWHTTDPAMNLQRQFMPVALALRLGILIAIVMLADALAAKRSPSARAQSLAKNPKIPGRRPRAAS